MIEYFTAPGSAPFTVSLLIMLGLLIFELVALFSGIGINEVVDDLIATNVELPGDALDAPGDVSTGIEGSGAPEGGSLAGRVLAWLYIGRVPVLMVLIVFLCVFALFGLTAQSLLRSTIGLAVPSAIAAPAVLILSLPIVRWCAGGLARLMPKDESSAVRTATFIGHTAVVVGGDARHRLAAQARLADRFGTTHYVMVEPEERNAVLENGSLVLLVRQIGGRFTAIPNPNQALTGDD